MITVKSIADSIVIIVDGDDSCKNFKELVQRATNLWPDAQPEIKEFADLITNKSWIDEAATQGIRPEAKTHEGIFKDGILQPYAAQAADKIRTLVKTLPKE